jgi:hypothetical protein
VINFFAFLRQQLFGIVQLPVAEFLRKDNCGCYDGPCEGAPSRFVDPRDRRDTERAEFAFMPKAATPIHRRKLLKV